MIHESTVFASPTGRGVAPCVTERESHGATLYSPQSFTSLAPKKPVGVDLTDDPPCNAYSLAEYGQFVNCPYKIIFCFVKKMSKTKPKR